MSDISLCYECQGSGPPLLLLHGNGEDGTYFCNQIKFFAKQYTAYAVDPRGHGKSPPGDHFIAAKNPGAFNQSVEQFLNDYKE